MFVCMYKMRGRKDSIGCRVFALSTADLSSLHGTPCDLPNPTQVTPEHKALCTTVCVP